MITRILQKVTAWATRNPAANPSIGDIATSHVAETIAEGMSAEAARDISKLRKATLSKPAADQAKNEATIINAQTKAELDSIRKRTAAIKESDAISKRLAAAKDPDEKTVLAAELKVARMVRLAAAYERYCEIQARLRMHGGEVIFEGKNLEELIREGRLLEDASSRDVSSVQLPRSSGSPPPAGTSPSSDDPEHDPDHGAEWRDARTASPDARDRGPG